MSGLPSDVTVRPMRSDDVATLLELVDAFAQYESLPRPGPAARRRMSADVVRRPAPIQVLFAVLDGVVVGYAAYYLTYSTFEAGPCLYLEDIFVLPHARGRGAGAALFQACAAETMRRGCVRMDWEVLDWNTSAIEFYERRGARQMKEWLNYRLDGDALRAAASGATVDPSAEPRER